MSEVATSIYYDAGDRKVTFLRVQDVEPVLEQNAKLRSARQCSDWSRHIASIPNVILERWLHEEMARGNISIRLSSKEFDALIARKLNDPDWRYLRTDK